MRKKECTGKYISIGKVKGGKRAAFSNGVLLSTTTSGGALSLRQPLARHTCTVKIGKSDPPYSKLLTLVKQNDSVRDHHQVGAMRLPSPGVHPSASQGTSGLNVARKSSVKACGYTWSKRCVLCCVHRIYCCFTSL